MCYLLVYVPPHAIRVKLSHKSAASGQWRSQVPFAREPQCLAIPGFGTLGGSTWCLEG